MDFFRIKEKSTKNGVIEVYPDFVVGKSKDLMVRARNFYAIWDEEVGLWSTDEYDVQRLVDAKLKEYRDNLAAKTDGVVQVKYMGDFSSKTWMEFRSFLSHISDSSVDLDGHLTFSNTKVKKTDYVSKRLPYPLEEGETKAYDEIMDVLYKPEERAKLEWAIGAVVSGEAKDIQKFIVLYGPPGAGKGTVLNIILKLFAGYYTTFEAKALTASGNAFATEVFRNNPLVAVQHDGDLSRIEDNSKLNSIISHEEMTMNEKFKPSYTSRINSFLFMGTNKPVKISDAKSGVIRRLIDVQPSGDKLPPTRYHALMTQINFELGAIAWKCHQVYLKMGRDYYSGYRPVEMMLQTDMFYNYIEYNYEIFYEQDGASLSQAFELYKTWCKESGIRQELVLPRHRFREELKNYFGAFSDVKRIDGRQVRSYYSNFLAGKFLVDERPEEHPYSLVMKERESLFDAMYPNTPAQYANSFETPSQKWATVTTKLSDLDTTQLHYTKLPIHHIVIDFDLRDETGEKSAEKNIAEASKWPPTYAEFSKGGKGVHLHYIYEGDPHTLARVFDKDIEIKVFVGDASLRRKLSYCNATPVAVLRSGLPVKEKKVLDVDTVQSERSLRNLVVRNLNKEIHPGTKPSIDFIHKILNDAYESDLQYDLTDMRHRILAFANGSSNQALYCIKLVSQMKFKSEEKDSVPVESDTDRVVYFDCEVFPNLFIVSWKFEGPDKKVVRMINPTPGEIEDLLRFKLIGFNNRRYDNHILYGRYMGYSNELLYKLSQDLIANKPGAAFGEAYGLSYADIYDYSTKRQSLKVFQIELGLNHQELGLPWDQPVPEELWDKVGEYCDNDVLTTEAVANARRGDFAARKILANLSGLAVNDTTQKHTAKIIFGGAKHPQEEFEYTDLSEMFPGYKYDFGTSTYKGEVTGEGGYVYAEPGMYDNVVLLDVASMHPTSIVELNLFGPFTSRFKALLDARLAIKHRQIEKAKGMLGGVLAEYLTSDEDAKALSDALKIAINIVYGLTSAKFDNAFKDMRNKDNIVAKRGALFMIDLKEFVQKEGFTVAHIKTDSIKIPGATPELINSIFEFGRKYGYDFEHELTYEKFCLVNEAVFIGKTTEGDWTATGAQFQHPYVFKKLFSHEEIIFDDLCETKSVTTALHLEMDEAEGEMERVFVGRAGRFTPIKPDRGGGRLVREKDGNFHSASGTTGFKWLEADTVLALNKEADVDYSYFEKLVDAAKDNIAKHGDVERFIA